jgi:hypothetical protein
VVRSIDVVVDGQKKTLEMCPLVDKYLTSLAGTLRQVGGELRESSNGIEQWGFCRDPKVWPDYQSTGFVGLGGEKLSGRLNQGNTITVEIEYFGEGGEQNSK